MHSERLKRMLEEVRAGRLDVDEAMARLTRFPTDDLEDLQLDHHRPLRTGIPETIYGEGKTYDQIERAVRSLDGAGAGVLVTRLNREKGERLVGGFPQGTWHPVARIFEIDPDPKPVAIGRVAVVCAGTSDIPVAEEAAVTARALGASVESAHDLGVSGIHRILSHRDLLREARVVIVVAGMEGALASVVAGLVSAVVIAVPTSVGYGAAFGGLAALLGMLNSCGSGVLVVNIDNGYGAGVAAARINRLAAGTT